MRRLPRPFARHASFAALALALAAAAAPHPARAFPVTVEFRFDAISGSLGGSAFTGAAMVITGLGDSDVSTIQSPGWERMQLTDVTFDIAGVAVVTASEAMGIWSGISGGLQQYIFSKGSGANLVEVATGAAPSAWSVDVSLEDVTLQTLQWAIAPQVSTSGGFLVLADGTAAGDFFLDSAADPGASAVPLPGALPLLAAALGGFALLRRRPGA